MRIGIFTDAYQPQISGVVTSILNSKKQLESLGHEVFIIAPLYKDSKLEKNVIRIKGLKFPFKKLAGYLWVPFCKKHTKEISKYNFDIIHVHTEFSIGSLGLHIAKKYNIPCIYTLHTYYEDYLDYLGILNKLFHNTLLKVIKNQTKKICNRVNHVIIPTNKVIELLNRYNINCDYSVIPSGLDLERYYIKNRNNDIINELKDKYNLHNKLVYIYLGRVSKEKSINVLVDAFHKLEKSDKRIFLICGFGPEEENLKKQIKNLNLENEIIMVGKIGDNCTQHYYHLGDIFLNASTSETQGLTYIEALASSLCLLVKKDKNIDYINNLENGILYNTNEELVEYINYIENNNELLTKIKNNSSSTTDKFSLEVYGQSLENLYLNVIRNNKK